MMAAHLLFPKHTESHIAFPILIHKFGQGRGGAIIVIFFQLWGPVYSDLRSSEAPFDCID